LAAFILGVGGLSGKNRKVREMVSTAVRTRRAKLLIAGSWVEGAESYPVYDKFTGELMGNADCASEIQVEAAVLGTVQAFHRNKLDAYERYEILLKVADLLDRRREEMIETIVGEAGFPVSDASNEVTRAAQTFILSAEEAKRLTGEGVPIESAPGNAHRMAFTIRVPRGVVCGITAFNSPLNMVAHKVAPALGAGNTVIIKPPQPTPFSAALLFEILLEAGLPPGHASLVQGLALKWADILCETLEYLSTRLLAARMWGG
jgi:acyl-CoA reductase-like NAD-dependent aldehyde dehydrogenase